MLQRPMVEVLEHKSFYCLKVHSQYQRRLTGVPGCNWNRAWECYTLPAGPASAVLIQQLFEGVPMWMQPEIIELANQFADASSVKDMDDLPDVPGSKTSAWQHQRRAFYFSKDLPGAMLAMDMGTGKSKCAVDLLNHHQAMLSFIFCPKSVVAVWPHEFNVHSGREVEVVPLLKGKNARDKAKRGAKRLEIAQATQRPVCFVINYESAWRGGMAEWIKSLNIDFIIFDEAHRIKSHNGRAAKFCASLVKTSRRRIGLTGTPMPHSPLDIFGQFKALSPDVFGTVWGRFQQRYGVKGGFQGKVIVGYQNEEELHEKFESIAFTVKAEDVLDLPPSIPMYRKSDLSPKGRRLYNQLNTDLYAEIEGGEITVANAMVKVLRLNQLTGGFLTNDEGERVDTCPEKRKLLEDTLLDIPQEEPVVIFSRFTADLQAIKAICEKLGRSCAELSGQVNQLEDWQLGEFNSLAVQIKAGGTGVDLTRSCFNIYYSVGHSLGDFLQSLKRSDRPGQTRSVRQIHLLMRQTVDEAIYAALEKKQDVIEFILEGIKEQIAARQQQQEDNARQTPNIPAAPRPEAPARCRAGRGEGTNGRTRTQHYRGHGRERDSEHECGG